MDIDLIDVEASGLHFDSYPIEVGVRIGGQAHSWLIKPEPQWTYWDAEAERLHGLSRERVIREGASAVVVARALDDLFANTNRIVYSDAAPWDDDWMKTLYAAAGTKRSWSILSLDELLSEPARRRFARELTRLQRDNPGHRHRAGSDIELILAAYRVAASSGERPFRVVE